jgi:hypothetical protein
MDLRLLGFLAAFIIALYVLGDNKESRDDREKMDSASKKDVTVDSALVALRQMEN